MRHVSGRGGVVRPRSFTTAQLLLTLGICLVLCLFGGCYDGQALVERARSAAVRSGIVEVDLGKYRTTLPRDAETNALTDVTVHVFGTVPRYRAAAIKKQLQADQYRLRHRALAAVRHATREELSEPDLARLRARIEREVNEVLAAAPVSSVGFYEVRLQYE